MPSRNPFAVQTPEDMSAEDANQLFVDVFTDFYHIPKPGHTFVNGARGTGKSMMFRFMLPDCQSLYLNRPVEDLDYLALYVPVKKTTINIIELNRLHTHADYMLNEHLLCTYIGARVFENLQEKLNITSTAANLAAVKSFYNDIFCLFLNSAGFDDVLPSADELEDVRGVLKLMQNLCDKVNLEVIRYVKLMSFTKDIPVYEGTICGYLDFLFPILKALPELPFLPNKTVYLLIDDADNLSKTQIMALNTWVSFRTSADVSLKISTQLNYRTFRTFSGITIDTPHDYSEVNISTAYTSSKEKYKERLTAIISRRLENVNINVSPHEFFPVDEQQEKKIKEIAERIKENYPDAGRGYRVNDDVYRMSRPEYFKSLSNRYSYKYAGFDQLVNISSGIIRYFLEPASLMYSEMISKTGSQLVSYIDPSVQDQQIREFAEQFLVNEFDKIKLDSDDGTQQVDMREVSSGESTDLTQTDKLRNLIEALGGLFHLMLLSDGSERRVFTIALADKPNRSVLDILKLGVRYGYLQERTIGNKDGTGRTTIYVLSRRLAPYFTLDPNGFSAYKSITSQDLMEAMTKPNSFLRKQKVKLTSSKDSSGESQLTIFEQ